MKISIIIPMFNVEKYIEKCLKSIGLELLKSNKAEIILINDGSTDNTKKICEEFIKQIDSDNIKLYNKQNSGVSAARNLGMEKATGEYIMFVDADDYLESSWFTIVNESIKDDKDIYYFSNQIKEGNKAKIISYIIGNNEEHIILSGPCSKLFKRCFICERNIKFNEKIINGEDEIFNLEVLSNTNNYEIIKKGFYQYRIYNSSSTKKYDNRIIESDRIFQDNLNDILLKLEIENHTKEAIASYCLYNGALTIIHKIAFIQNYNKAKEKFNFLQEKPYKVVSLQKDLLNDYPLKKRLVFFLIRHKYYHLIYNILQWRIKNGKSKKEYYVIL